MISLMKFWVGVTDNRWFEFLRSQHADEANFWQPSGKAPFKHLPAGTPFLFKLKRPHHHIAGGGTFLRFTRLPVGYAWNAFGTQNGVARLQDLQNRIRDLGDVKDVVHHDIGCNVLASIFYLPRDLWIDVEYLFPRNIVTGKSFDTAEHEGMSLWRQVELARRSSGVMDSLDEEHEARFGAPFLTQARLGQGAFRALVTDAYQRRCAITGESTLPTLEAAHIRPYSENGTHSITNGLLLRSDFHRLFDSGLITVEPDMTIRISRRIRDSWFNGKAYYTLDRRQLQVVPEDTTMRPDPDLLKWHNDNRYAE